MNWTIAFFRFQSILSALCLKITKNVAFLKIKKLDRFWRENSNLPKIKSFFAIFPKILIWDNFSHFQTLCMEKSTGYKLWYDSYEQKLLLLPLAAVLATQTSFRFLWLKWPSKTSLSLFPKNDWHFSSIWPSVGAQFVLLLFYLH